jgi:hypothetical protein
VKKAFADKKLAEQKAKGMSLAHSLSATVQ